MSAACTELDAALEVAILEHDRRTAKHALWLGAEPTFTDRDSEAAEWLADACGDDKEERARRLIALLAARRAGALIMRPLGRQYPNEDLPRFCYGLYERRDGAALWSGPPDRLRDGVPLPDNHARARELQAALCVGLREVGWFAEPLADVEGARVLLRPDGRAATCDARADARLARESVHGVRVEGAGPVDVLAEEGSYLVLLHAGAGGADCNEAWVELPAFTRVDDLLRFLEQLGSACRECAIGSLGIRGFPPCVDDRVAWTTITPDPAVLEVNQAPYADLGSFHRASRELFELAHEVGLSPYRLQYNGAVSDSGGGGQLTFGGPSPEQSPFFTCPQLLPRLVRYVVRHPSLSYWFATQYVGGSSQSPRPDEGANESFHELEVALEQLALLPAATPAELWGTLRHFLVDASGNPHRSALNIEKLDNPFVPGRGRLGLVELRALAMAPSAAVSTARAMLLRAVVALLMERDLVVELTHWQDVLHDRFALPFYLELDLREVLADLAEAGLGLGPELEACLLDRDDSLLADVRFGECRIRVWQALEFWPLVGDAAAQEGVGSRLVDASTARIELCLEGPDGGELEAIEVAVNGHRVPLRSELGPRGPSRVFGLRYRSFVPFVGLHPSMPAERRIELIFKHRAGNAARLILHSWRPDGEAYPGLPVSLEDARARRLERAQFEAIDAHSLPPAREAPPSALTPHNLDLRRLPRNG